MYQIFNLTNNPNVDVLDRQGPFTVIAHRLKYESDSEMAMVEFFSSVMKQQHRQLICSLSKGDIILQPSRMQWMIGDVTQTTGLKGMSDWLSKSLRASLTADQAVKPVYSGNGLIAVEPTMEHIILVDLADWHGSIVLAESRFLACEVSVKPKLSTRKNMSSAALGNEGLFNLMLTGKGIAALETPMPKEELVEIHMYDDVLKIDGNYAVAWSGTLDFTVEKSGKTYLGSALSKEGLLNVYRGTGKIWIAPLLPKYREQEVEEEDEDEE